MKRYLVLSLILLILCSISPPLLCAQGRDRSMMNGKDTAVRELNLSDEQRSTIKRIRASYMKKILQLKSDAVGKQHEFKGLIGDPDSSEEMIRGKGREIEAINSQIMREAIEYELSVRRILTPEQIRMWSNIDSSPPIRRSSGR
jgi:Spy/CpxP family protein refolding chaperone